MPSISRNIRAVVVAACLVAAFWPILVSIYGSWFDPNAYMEHGILVIPAAGYIAWTKRDELARVPVRPSFWGIPLLLWGAGQAILGTAAHWMWISRTAFLVSLAGCIAVTYGFQMMRSLAYPLSTLILMIPPPALVFERVTWNLQMLVSRLGETSLELMGYSVVREGNILELVGTKLSVEEACSGIRSLFAILFMCVLYNYFFVRGNFMRALLLVMAVPIAILGNVCRIVATGVASQYNQQLIRGTAHEIFGYVSLIAAGIGCVILHRMMLSIQKVWRSRNAKRRETYEAG